MKSSHKCHHSENFCSAAFERSPNAECGWTHVYVYNRIAHYSYFSNTMEAVIRRTLILSEIVFSGANMLQESSTDNTYPKLEVT